MISCYDYKRLRTHNVYYYSIIRESNDFIHKLVEIGGHTCIDKQDISLSHNNYSESGQTVKTVLIRILFRLHYGLLNIGIKHFLLIRSINITYLEKYNTV